MSLLRSPRLVPPGATSSGSSSLAREDRGDPDEHWPHLDALVPADLTRMLLESGAGDLDAFESYYRMTSPVLATLIAARRLSPAASDAVLVDVYVTIRLRAHTFADSGCSVWQWTLTILLETIARTDRSNGRLPPGSRPAPRTRDRPRTISDLHRR